MFSTRRCIILLLLVGAVGLGIRGWLRREPVNSDDAQYFGLDICASSEDVLAPAAEHRTGVIDS